MDYSHREDIFNRLKNHDDLHILDLNKLITELIRVCYLSVCLWDFFQQQPDLDIIKKTSGCC